MRDVAALFPALALAPSAPALVDADGTVLNWDVLTRVVVARAREIENNEPHARTHLLHASTSRALVVDIWASQLASQVPVFVHPRVPEARSRALFDDVTRALAGAARDQPSPSQTPLAGASLSPRVDEPANAAVVFTSGSTRAPRGVLLSLAAMRESARAANAHIAFSPGERWLLGLPLVHVGGLGILERARVGGGAVVIPPVGHTLTQAVLVRAITHLSLVSAQLLDAVEQQMHTSATLKAVLVGGGPVSPALLARARALPLAQTWGMTETCAQVATSAPFAPETCGLPLAGREVRVSPDGELLVRGGALASGLIDDDGLRALPLDDDGFLHTRDRGALTAEGHVVVHGRIDTVFISGGENIQPELVEQALLEHPHVRRALVVPVAHARFGARPVAFVEAQSGSVVDERVLTGHLEQRLARHEVPDAFLPWPVDDAGGKPSRPHFAARAALLLGTSRVA
jgi:O-succinylbenzoic acid--CoA ligase